MERLQYFMYKVVLMFCHIKVYSYLNQIKEQLWQKVKMYKNLSKQQLRKH